LSRILINGVKSTTGGGKSILKNILSLLKTSSPKNDYYVLTPDKYEYEMYSCDYIHVVEINRFFKYNAMFPLLYYFVLPRLLKNLRVDVIFNLGDIIIPSRIPQVYLFDWAFAIYPESDAWKRLGLKSLIYVKVKLYLFKKHIKYVTNIIAQTDVAKKRLETIFHFKNIKVVPNAVSIENLHPQSKIDFDLPDGIKLLYLTYYYPHKNLEIFIPLAKIIKERDLNYRLIVTIDESQSAKSKAFLRNIKKNNVDDVIINIGPVKMEHVPSLYEQCQGLLIPTLLESFSGTYVESMFHKISIFTSDYDFARCICKDAAFYFDPLDIFSIINAIEYAFNNQGVRITKIAEGQRLLQELLTWEQAFVQYDNSINSSFGLGVMV